MKRLPHSAPLPGVMRGVSPRQMVVDAKSGVGGHPLLATANLGKVINFTCDGARNPQPQLAVRADIATLPNGDVLDGANWIVTVRPGSKRGGAINSPFWQANVRFGTGGVLTELNCTANPGFSVSLPSDFVEVEIGVNPYTNGSIIAAGEYDFDVTLHRGIPNGDSEVRWRVQTNGVSGLLPVPPFAKYFMPVSPTCYGAGVTASFSGGFTYTAAEFQLIKQSGGVPFVPVGDSTIFWQPEAAVYVFDWILEL